MSTATDPTNKIIGSSTNLRAALASARKVAQSELPVLVTGEIGTGKELFARLIHDESPRAKAPFVVLNCVAFPEWVFEEELFGYKKGAFDGAVSNHDGLFAQANGGTLFLDGIGDMPLLLQAKILRVLQEGEVRPLGAKDGQKINVRLVSATHQNLGEMVARGDFLQDLLSRLCVYVLHLPPLRDRERDAITLARAVLESHPKFANKNLSRDAKELLLAYSWHWNVRELQNVVRGAAMHAPKRIEAKHLYPHLVDERNAMPVTPVMPIVERLLAELADGRHTTLAQLHNQTHIPKPTLHYHLKRLVEQGKIHRLANAGRVCFALTSSLDASEQTLLDRHAQAVLLAKASGRITRQQLASALGVSIRTASRELATMVNLGLLASDNQGGRMAGYVPCNR